MMTEMRATFLLAFVPIVAFADVATPAKSAAGAAAPTVIEYVAGPPVVASRARRSSSTASPIRRR
jgi:hypothetical protein